MAIFQSRRNDDMEEEAYQEYEEDVTKDFHVPKKRKNAAAASTDAIPRKKRS
jgi:hypothetical protein